MKGPDDKPLLVLGAQGKGRVALLLSDQMWLWARGFQGGGPQLDLLRRLSHWLMKEPDLEEEALRLKVNGHNLVVQRQTMSDHVADVTVTSPSGVDADGQARSGPARACGRARSRPANSACGARPMASSTRWSIWGRPIRCEFAEVTSTTDVLAPIAKATGGSSRRLDDGDGLQVPRVVAVRSGDTYQGDGWIGLKMTDASVVRGIGVLPVFVGLLGLLLLARQSRRHLGARGTVTVFALIARL